MSLTSEKNSNNKNLGLNMSKRVKDNSVILHQLASEVKGDAVEYASDLVELYKKRQITQARTVKRLVAELQNTNEKKQKLGIKHAKQAIGKYAVDKPITRRLRKKTNMKEKETNEQPITRRLRQKTNVKTTKTVLGEKIVKLFRNRLKFKNY